MDEKKPDARTAKPVEPAKPGGDVLLLHSPTPDGQGVHVLRARDGRLEAGVVRPLEEGKSIAHGEVVKLTPRAEAPAVCDVEVQYAPPAQRGKPGQVATQAYRESWDRIFDQTPQDADAPDLRLN